MYEIARPNPASGTTAAGFEAPERVVENLETSTRPPFHGTIGGRTYRSSAASRGGQFMLGVSAEILNSAGVIAPDEVEGDIELDIEPREVTVASVDPYCRGQ
jgi:hypothetical protein